MNNKNKIRILLASTSLLALASCGSLANQSSPSPISSTPTSSTSVASSSSKDANLFTIVFKDEDGTILQSSQMASGEMPFCPGPKKADDETYSYTFKDWSPIPVTVSRDMTYTATYLKVSKNATKSLGYTLNADEKSYTCSFCNRSEKNVIVAACYDGMPVTGIANETFEGNKNLVSVVLPDTLVSIGKEAFADCTGLTSLNIPDALTSIGVGAFSACKGLSCLSKDGGYFYGNADDPYRVLVSLNAVQKQTLTLPATTKVFVEQAGKEIGPSGLAHIKVDAANPYLYSDDRALYSKDLSTFYTYAEASGDRYTLLPGVKRIADGAFYCDAALVGVSLPSGVTSIGESAFQGCTALKDLRIGDGLLSLGEKAFYQDSALTSVHLSDSVNSIGNQAFAECSTLENIDLGSNLTEIPNDLFADDKLLSHLSLPSSLKDIGASAFRNCTSLASFELPSSNTFLSTDGRGVYKKSELGLLAYADASGSTYEVQAGTMKILLNAFVGCSHLTEVTLPDSLSVLYPYAFDSCSALTNISFSTAVTALVEDTFLLCHQLSTLTYGGTKAEWLKINKTYNWFQGCENLKTVVCTNGNYDL